MDVSVEISFYPLNRDYIPPIQDFIDWVNKAEGLIVKTNVMSTQVSGKHGKNIFVMKVLPGDLDLDH